MIRSDRWGTPLLMRAAVAQRVLKENNLGVDCGGAVTEAATALRNSIRVAALILFGIGWAGLRHVLAKLRRVRTGVEQMRSSSRLILR